MANSDSKATISGIYLDEPYTRNIFIDAIYLEFHSKKTTVPFSRKLELFFFQVKYQWIFKLNPMAVIINAYRKVILAQGAPNLQSLGIALGVSVIILATTYKLFKKAEGVFADIV